MPQPIVETAYGRLQGITAHGVRSFKGIPYASVPVGDLRFRAPAAPEPWDGVRDASGFGPFCPQPGGGAGGVFGEADGGAGMSEDCLYLNVWTPEDAGDGGLPVMVWIHGGAFETGSGSIPAYDGIALAARGKVVAVTLNYRLGPLGFLHLHSLHEDFTPNAGLLDQIAALRWVQGNIAAFGGDPESVTVFGESAGSMSIAALLAMPGAKGLFARAIMESGSSQALSAEQARAICAGLLEELGLSPQEAGRLRAMPAAELIEAGERMKRRMGGMGMPFQPVIDPATLPVPPIEAVRSGAAAGIPLLIGTNRDEGALFFRPDSPSVPDEVIASAMELLSGGHRVKPFISRYASDFEGRAELMTDLYFWRGALEFAMAQSSHAPVWMYRFDWTLPSHPLLRKAVHAAEIPFVFGTLPFLQQAGLQIPPTGFALSEQMQEAWIAFAHGRPPGDPGEWPVYESGERATMIFGDHSLMVKDPDADKRLVLGI